MDFDFKDFKDVEFPAHADIVYIVYFRKPGDTSEVPFYVGQTSRHLGRIVGWKSHVADTIFWICAARGTVIALLIAMVDESNKDYEREQAEFERRRQIEERERQEQEAIRASLVQSAESSIIHRIIERRFKRHF
jgi:hypothetical protein